MKKHITILILLLLAVNSNAATSITTSAVSGHWTLSGSPYNIYNNITLGSADTLTIDPGVEIVFMGNFTMTVSGVIYSSGTAAQPISYHVNDTTGWSDASDTTGGWGGIEIYPYYASLPDNSTFQYCNVYDTKQYPSSIGRNLTITNCNFFHNKSGALNIVTFSPFTTTISNCNFYNNQFNSTYFSTLEIAATSTTAGSVLFHHNNVYGNNAVSEIFCSNVSLLLDSNSIYQDTGSSSILELQNCIATVRNNRVYENITNLDGAISSFQSVTDINSNYICNNHVLSPGVGSTCGHSQGGGGIRLDDEGDTIPSSNIVRNNIIANNYTAYYGSAIYIIGANATICNNQIVNNSAVQGGIYLDAEFGYRITVKNNILYNNISYGYDADFGFTFNDSMNFHMGGVYPDTLVYENNWTQRNYSSDNYVSGLTTPFIMGDTLTNIIGSNPGLIAPTLTASDTESAISADFGLLYTSDCINTGDSTNASVFPTDYSGNQRIIGSNIDIGAYEFNSFCSNTISGIFTFCQGTTQTLSDPVPGGIWSSPQSPLVVTIDSLTGAVTGASGGVATIYYRVGGCVASENVAVNTLPDSISGNTGVCLASSISLSSMPAGGAWTVSTGTATVLSDGTVTGISLGTAIISYSVTNSCGTGIVTKTITVNPNPVAITGPDSICIGYSITLSDATSGGTWSVSDPSLVTLSYSAGTAYGVIAGIPVITYSLSTGCYSTYPISVVACPEGVKLVNGNHEIKIYPNPAFNEITVSSFDQINKIELINYLGQKVFAKEYTSQNAYINISNFPAGLYFIKVNDKYIEKLIKE
jgi:hypothetical protein